MPRGLRYSPFLDRRFEEIEESDLSELIERQVREGLLVEYKREWTTEKVARAAASFANSEAGGTLIVGVEADGLDPVSIFPLTTPEDLEEAAVAAIRTRVTPTPSMRPRAIRVEGGKVLVLEVLPGADPPYIYIPRGQVLVRTPTSSEPVGVNDRESVDRLFLRGRRALQWASKMADDLIAAAKAEDPPPIDTSSLWTIPIAEEGFDVSRLIFTKSFEERLMQRLASTGPWVHEAQTQSVRQGATSVAFVSLPSLGDPTFRLTVHVRAAIGSQRRQDQVGSGPHFLMEHARDAFVHHASILQEQLGYFGRVRIAVFNRWPPPGSDAAAPRMTLHFSDGPFPVEAVGGDEFLGRLRRSVQRLMGRTEYEPEPDITLGS